MEHCINSDGILELKEVPKRLGIIGGGYIGVEFGGMFNNLGSEVEFFIRGDKLLRGFDEEMRDKLHEEYGKQGITISSGCALPSRSSAACLAQFWHYKRDHIRSRRTLSIEGRRRVRWSVLHQEVRRAGRAFRAVLWFR